MAMTDQLVQLLQHFPDKKHGVWSSCVVDLYTVPINSNDMDIRTGWHKLYYLYKSRKIPRAQGKLSWQNRFSMFLAHKFGYNPLTCIGCIASYG